MKMRVETVNTLCVLQTQLVISVGVSADFYGNIIKVENEPLLVNICLIYTH